jgi:hypothetical protein
LAAMLTEAQPLAITKAKERMTNGVRMDAP